MRHLSSTLAIALTLAAVRAAQPLEFDAASLKLLDPASPPAIPAGGPGTGAPGRYSTRTRLIDLLRVAYGLPDDQITGLPASLALNLYQLDATMPPGTTRPAFEAMLQTLLAQRLHLAFRRETKSYPAFDLVVARNGPSLKDASAAAPDAYPVLPPGPHIGRSLHNGNLRFKFQEKSMADLAATLGNLIDQSVGSRSDGKRPRVTDKTGLTALYTFTLEFACADCVASRPVGAAADPPPAADDAPSIFTALEKQLGLKAVKAADVSLEVIVIDHIDRVPIAN
jgi:uncharacterized protein (TIGR03435 family)